VTIRITIRIREELPRCQHTQNRCPQCSRPAELCWRSAEVCALWVLLVIITVRPNQLYTRQNNNVYQINTYKHTKQLFTYTTQSIIMFDNDWGCNLRKTDSVKFSTVIGYWVPGMGDASLRWQCGSRLSGIWWFKQLIAWHTLSNNDFPAFALLWCRRSMFDKKSKPSYGILNTLNGV